MDNIKAINKTDVEKLIIHLEEKLKRIKELANEATDTFGAYKTIGYAEGSIEFVIKQLKGEYPII